MSLKSEEVHLPVNIDSSEEKLEEIAEKYARFLRSNGITDKVSEVVVKDAGLKGEGLTSETQCVTVHFENSCLRPLNLFVKTEATNPSLSKFLEETKLFDKESTFFMKYIPDLKDFCRSKGQEKLLEIYPKCYYGDTKIIVLEHLVLEKGYELLDKTEKQDFNMASLALETLAKHHALSYAFMKEVGSSLSFFEKYPALRFETYSCNSMKTMLEPFIENMIKTNIQILEKSKVDGKEEAMELLQAKVGNVWDVIMATICCDEEDTAQILVLNHGDYWNNNMMFLRDKRSNKLGGPVIIDFQIMRYSSPGLDLAFFMFSSVKSDVRAQRFKELLHVYLNALNSTSEKLNHPINLSYDELFLDYRKKLNVGVWFVGIVTATKACHTVMKDFDISTVSVEEWGDIFSGLIQKWIAANPETCEQDASKIVDLMKEFKAYSFN